jgi:hypothetical protein
MRQRGNNGVNGLRASSRNGKAVLGLKFPVLNPDVLIFVLLYPWVKKGSTFSFREERTFRSRVEGTEG